MDSVLMTIYPQKIQYLTIYEKFFRPIQNDDDDWKSKIKRPKPDLRPKTEA